MFQKKPTIINGIRIPDRDARVTSIINNVAIYDDNHYVAVDGKNIIEGDIPANGELNIGGSRIKVSPHGGSINISGSSIGGSFISSMSGVRGVSIVQSGGSVSITGGSQDMYDIDETYPLKAGDEVKVDTRNSSLILGLNQGEYALVKGSIAEKPKYQSNILFVSELEGKIALPRGISALEVAIDARNGSITGDVMHPGSIETRNGSIVLNLYAPMKVDAATCNGNVDVIGMVSQGNGRYVPANASPVGKLKAESRNGSVLIRYVK